MTAPIETGCDVSVVIVSWNTRDLLDRCLRHVVQSVRAHTVEVIVVDNASTDDTVRALAATHPDVRWIANTANVGFARGNNQGFDVARGRYVLLLNSDAFLCPGALDALVTALDRHPTAAAASARLVGEDGVEQHCARRFPVALHALVEALRLHRLVPRAVRGRWLLGYHWTYDATIPVDWVWGTCMLVRRAVIEAVGGLDGRYFMYGEDMEWCWRMRNAGWNVIFVHDAEAVHLGSQSARQLWRAVERDRRIWDATYAFTRSAYGPVRHRALWCANILALGAEWLRQVVFPRAVDGPDGRARLRGAIASHFPARRAPLGPVPAALER